jgi:hypothetical protein
MTPTPAVATAKFWRSDRPQMAPVHAACAAAMIAPTDRPANRRGTCDLSAARGGKARADLPHRGTA